MIKHNSGLTRRVVSFEQIYMKNKHKSVKMNEIKLENNLNVVCHGCLSSERRTSPLGTLSETFLDLFGSNKQSIVYAIEDVKLCWECVAVLRKFKSFQNKLKNAQTVLMQMLYDLSFNPVTLSSLATVKKYYYDQEYQYTVKKGKVEKIEEIPSLDIELPKENDLPIEIDNRESIKEEFTEYDSVVDDTDTHENELLYNDIGVIKDYHNFNESEGKKIRAKRRKLAKSRDNSVSHYKQYATLLEREKIDWGKIDDYFTMVSFGESEMEEHFLSKERKFSEYSRFQYKCVPCELGFLRNFDLKRHNNLNHYKKPELKCTVCHKPASSIEDLALHWHDHTPIAKCKLCGDACRPRGMKNHLNYAHTKKYACQFCNLKFGTILHFSVHYKAKHQNYICDYCNTSCKSKTLVQKHIRTHHTQFRCHECDRQYMNYRQYKRHNYELHPDRVKERPEMAYCVECDKQYASVTKYKKHLKISPKHTEIKRILLPCPDCGKVFKRRNYLNNHYNLYHAKKSKHYCELCDKYFANGYGLRKHKAHVHLKVTRVKDKMCDLCGRGFATNRILLNHRRTHTGERPYQCPFCTAAFTQKQAMQSHCRTQHKDVK